MDQELNLAIDFPSSLSEKEQESFWDLLIDEIEKMGLRGVEGNLLVNWIGSLIFQILN